MQKSRISSWLDQHRSCLLIVATMGLYAIPLIFDLVRNGYTKVFSYLAADSFYYFTIARNFAQTGLFSFDGQFATNGFHPLWQLILGLISFLTQAVVADKSFLVVVFVINVIIISAAIFLILRFMQKRYGYVPAFALFIPAGVYGVIAGLIYPQYGTLWSFTNGMESGLSLLSFALLLNYFPCTSSRKNWKSTLLQGLLLGLLLMSRLDNIFFLVSLGMSMLVDLVRSRRPGQIRGMVTLFLPVVIILSIYFVWNKASVGTYMPVSGLSKSTFPSIDAGITKLRFMISLIGDPQQPWAVHYFWRFSQLLVPAAFALVYFVTAIIRSHRKTLLAEASSSMMISALFVLLLSAYNFLFVPLWDQGHWYYPISTTLVTMMCIDAFIQLNRNHHFQNQRYRLYSSGLILVLILSIHVRVYSSTSYNTHYARFFDSISLIHAAYEGEVPKLVEFDDGIVAYATGYPSMAGLGFALDREALVSKENNVLLETAYSRGYKRVTSLNYFNASGLSLESSSDEIKERLSQAFFLNPLEVEPFTWRVEYLSEDGRYAIFLMEKENYDSE